MTRWTDRSKAKSTLLPPAAVLLAAAIAAAAFRNRSLRVQLAICRPGNTFSNALVPPLRVYAYFQFRQVALAKDDCDSHARTISR